MKKKLKILKKQKNELIKDAIVTAKDNGREICGLLVDNGYFIEIIKVKNKSKKGGSSSFYFKEIRVIQKAVKQMSHKIIGTFHSHPFAFAEPGDTDMIDRYDEYMLIVDVMDKAVGLWYIKNSKKKTKIEIELI